MKYERLEKYVSLSQGLVVNKGTADLFSDIQDDDHPYPLLRIVDFENGNHASYSKYVSKDVPEKNIIDENAILFTRVTCQCFRGFSGVFHNNLFRVELVNDEITEDYLYVMLQSDYVKKQALQFTSSSVVPDLSHDKFKAILIPVPDVDVQNEIVSVYTNLQSKIDNNNAICLNLEAMAKLLYEYWFVQFDFPDENGKPYKSSGGKMVWSEELKREIPAGWEVKRIGDIISTERGISYSTPNIITGEGVPMLNLATFMPGGGDYKADGLKHYLGDYPKNKVLKPFELIMCNTQQTAIKFEKDIIGRAMLVPDIFDGDVVFSHHVNVIRTDNEYLKYYLLYLFNSDYFHKYISGHTNGTNILGLSFNGVEDYHTEIPSGDLLEAFGKRILEIEKKKSEIFLENEQLASLRDFLLPMLMNGQVKINTAGE